MTLQYKKNPLVVAVAFATAAFTANGLSAAGEPDIPKGVKKTAFDANAFSPDPTYEKTPYSIEKQLKIYGDKAAIDTPRPAVELGRDIYSTGAFGESYTFFGERNPTNFQFSIYGDWRNTLAYNKDVINGDVVEKGVIATRLNLDIDFQLTGTERIHAFVQPFDDDGVARCEFAAEINGIEQDDDCFEEFNLDPAALFFEGDLAQITTGITGEFQDFDLPFAVGLIPLLFQNGVWLEDAFEGFAFTFPALNSPLLDISNMDITFFAGFNDVETALVVDDADDVSIYGVTAFIEANEGYYEIGYGYTDDENGVDGNDQSYHNLTVAFSRRYGGWLSNSVRAIAAVGQDVDNNDDLTADGYLLLLENSLITSKPSTFIPYANFFVGVDKPQSLARAGAAGQVLENTGINFETDGISDFPFLTATGEDSYGGAVGLQYLFGLDQQFIIELATVQFYDDLEDNGDEYAVGVRYQLPLSKSWIFRTDAMVGLKDDEDIYGIRTELRRKF